MSGGIVATNISGKADVTMTTNGDTLYYNSGRQRLAKGSDGTVLTLASGLPSWAAAGSSGQMELLDSHEATGSENSYTYTPSTALNLSDTYSKIIINWSLYECSATSEIQMVLNGLTSGYVNDGFKFDGSSITNISGGSSNISLENGVVASVGYKGISEIIYNVSGGGHTKNLNVFSRGAGDLGSFRVGNIWQGRQSTTSTETITSIKIQMLSSHTWVSGSTIMTYGVKI